MCAGVFDVEVSCVVLCLGKCVPVSKKVSQVTVGLKTEVVVRIVHVATFSVQKRRSGLKNYLKKINLPYF